MSENQIENPPEDMANNPDAVIGQIMQEVHAMGANDSEIGELGEIRTRWHAGECSAEDACKAAREIRARKMEYR